MAAVFAAASIAATAAGAPAAADTRTVRPGAAVAVRAGGFAAGGAATAPITGVGPALPPDRTVHADRDGVIAVSVEAPVHVGDYRILLVGAPRADPSGPSPGNSSGNPAALRVVVPRLVLVQLLVRAAGVGSTGSGSAGSGSTGSVGAGSAGPGAAGEGGSSATGSPALTGIDVVGIIAIGVLALVTGAAAATAGWRRRMQSPRH